MGVRCGGSWRGLQDPPQARHRSGRDGDNNEVRDFTWKLTGEDANGDDRRGWVYIHPSIFDPKDIEITFTPDGPLIDGSQGKVIVATFSKQPLKAVPVGRCRLKERHVPTNGPCLILAKGDSKASPIPVVMVP